MEIKLTSIIAPHFYQLVDDFLNERHSHYWLEGGRGSTKSTVASMLLVLGIVNHPEAHAVCTRKYKTDLHGSVYSQIIKSIHLLGLDHMFKVSARDDGAPPITYRPTGQKIFFAGLDDPEGIKSLTSTFGYIKYSWYEEVHQLSGMDKIRSANQTIRRGSDQRFITFYTYNPPRNKGSWVNQESQMLENNPEFVVSKSNWEMIPNELALKWLGKDWISDALTLKERDPNAYLHEYMGVPVGYGTNVFPNIDIRDMDDDEIRSFDNVVGGIDWGFANDPVAYTRSHFDIKKRILYIFDEIFEQGVMNRQLAYRILLKAPVNELIICDSAEPKSISEIKEAGLRNAVKAKKGPGSVESGTKFLQELTLIVIDKKRCPNTAREFINAEFDVDRFGNVVNRIADHDNHSIDSIRYRMEKEMKRKSGWGKK